jgi:broad specificity phosphatase PhoE
MTLAYHIVHATSTDNENEVVSGQFDSPLSDLGKKQAQELFFALKKKQMRGNPFGFIILRGA